MSGSATYSMRNDMIGKYFLGVTLPWTQFHLCLTRKVPTTNSFPAQLDEPPAGVGYARVVLSVGLTDWEVQGNALIINKNSIYFPTATGFWGAINGWALVSVESDGGRCKAVGTLNTPLKVTAGIRPYLVRGDINFQSVEAL